MVYEGTITSNVLTSYVQFNSNCSFSTKINNNFYNLLRITIYHENTTIPYYDNKNLRIINVNENINTCEDKYINTISNAIRMKMLRMFAYNKNTEKLLLKKISE